MGLSKGVAIAGRCGYKATGVSYKQNIFGLKKFSTKQVQV